MIWQRLKQLFQAESELQNSAETIVVIGVHKEELAFGDEVARHLDRTLFSPFRIASGLSARRPRTDQLEQYLTNHEQLYTQIADHMPAHCKLLIDLHCRLKAEADADIFCASPDLLNRISESFHTRFPKSDARLRTIRMVSDADLCEWDDTHEDKHASGHLLSKPELPEVVWRATRPAYVGLEIYLDHEGRGEQENWDLTLQILSAVRSAILD
ncbi:hypothetical protein [uncultured Cohaesibacter sp.]|uniref:hypothetical protein n=1 Tax=uncultured Cohaesibacter sp. TaxID=1002546 RepID=UPI00292FB223|nr:hypothetical protein [uncultured Cohaesibacter sp.]